MVTTTIPPRMDRSEAAHVCGLAPGSSACDRAQEQAAAWEGYLDQRKVENDRLRSEREAREAAEAKTRADGRESERAAAAAALREGLRRTFFSANPAASEDDYQRLAGRLYDDELMRRATEGRNADVEALRRSGGYGSL
ncbi:MAG: hypothetical protein H0V00_04295 [Chloroflexia bacterium]|nr:hypothetical protein [Chloroflexia bacterium]